MAWAPASWPGDNDTRETMEDKSSVVTSAGAWIGGDGLVGLGLEEDSPCSEPFGSFLLNGESKGASRTKICRS